MNIRKSLYLIICALILCPFLLFSFVISHVYNARLQAGIQDCLQAVSNAQIAEMTSFCEQQMDQLRMLGDTSVFRAALAGELDAETLGYANDLLASRVATVDYLESTALIDMDYHVAACSEPGYKPLANEGFADLANSIGSESFYISNVLTSRTGEDARQAVVAISRIEEDGVTQGYILAEISLDFYNSIRHNSMQENDATFYLLDGNGQIISAGTSQDDRTSFITTKEQRADYNKKYNSIDHEKYPSGSFTFQLDGTRYITYYSDIDYTKWTVMLTVNLDQYLSQNTIYLILGGFVILLCLAMTLWIGFFTSRRIIKPVNRISETLEQLQKNQDYSLRVDLSRKDEMGLLSEKINHLIAFIEAENRTKAQNQLLLKQKAEQDALTGVMNKACIEQVLAKTIDRCRQNGSSLAVLFADIDDFKSFNSLYGHSVGDQALQFFASLLVRHSKGPVGRLGGDEFLILLENPGTLQDLEALLEQIKTASDNSFVLRGISQKTPISCCIGAVLVDFSAEIPEEIPPRELIDFADALMYQAKNHGKHGYVADRIGEI